MPFVSFNCGDRVNECGRVFVCECVQKEKDHSGNETQCVSTYIQGLFTLRYPGFLRRRYLLLFCFYRQTPFFVVHRKGGTGTGFSLRFEEFLLNAVIHSLFNITS